MFTAMSLYRDIISPQNVHKANQTAWLNSVRASMTFLMGIGRENISFVPFHSKSYFSTMLKLYFDQISVYDEEYNRLLDNLQDRTEYIRTVERMLQIRTTSDIADAQSEFDMTLRAFDSSNATYRIFYKEYEQATSVMINAQAKLESEIVNFQHMSSFLIFTQELVGGIIRLIQGGPSKGAAFGGVFDVIKNTIERIKQKKLEKKLMKELSVEIDDLAASMYKVFMGIVEIEIFMESARPVVAELKDPASNYDYTSILDAIQGAENLQVDIVHWKNLKNNMEAIMMSPVIEKLDSSTDYMRAILDLTNWGEALVASGVQYAELLRDCIEKRYLLDNAKTEAAEYEKYFGQLKQNLLTPQQMMLLMVEHQYDVRLRLNHILESFCQAYFYETLSECKDSIKPSFGGSLPAILLKVNQALIESHLINSDAPSSVARTISIVDDSGTASCSDIFVCPIRQFVETGHLYLKLAPDHPSLRDIDRYRVREIELDFVGAKVVDSEYLTVYIESSGTFEDRYSNNIFSFIIRSVGLSYEYSLIKDDVSIRANVDDDYAGKVQHVTPFTTWIIRVANSSSIDVSGVTEVKVRFIGSGIKHQDDV